MKRHIRPALVAIFALCAGLFVFSAATAQPQPADPQKPFTGKIFAVADHDLLEKATPASENCGQKVGEIRREQVFL